MAPPGPAGPPQFPSTDAATILALLSQLQATDQQAFIAAQAQAPQLAIAQMMQSQPDPNAAAAVTAPGGPAPPTLGSMDQQGGAGTGY